MDDCSMRLSCRGGDAGGVAGSPPGEHSGMCLLGIAVGVPREEVLSDRCGGGVEERPSIEGYLATAAAMLTSPRPGVEMERRRVTWEEGEKSIGRSSVVAMALPNQRDAAEGSGDYQSTAGVTGVVCRAIDKYAAS
jgi:hypothetical protein